MSLHNCDGPPVTCQSYVIISFTKLFSLKNLLHLDNKVSRKTPKPNSYILDKRVRLLRFILRLTIDDGPLDPDSSKYHQ